MNPVATRADESQRVAIRDALVDASAALIDATLRAKGTRLEASIRRTKELVYKLEIELERGDLNG